MRWAWHQAWAEAAPPEDVRTSFAVQLQDPEGSVQGILPLTIRPLPFRRREVRALTWATRDVGCPDHLDIPASATADLDGAVPVLEALPWDVVVLSGLAEEATNVSRLGAAFLRHGCTVHHAPIDACPYLDLPASWDAYLGSLSATRRQTIRRKERKAMRDHSAVVTDYAPDRLEEGWHHLVALHEERWAGAGSLGDPQLGRLLRRFSSALAARGELWLTTLDLDGAPAAAWLGFACGDTVFFYQGGRDPRWEASSVGLVLMAQMIRRAIESGYRRFDFLRGREEYKRSWTSLERPVGEVVIFRRGWRGIGLRGLDWAGRARERLRG
jgi:CelD/BcsL family acetyltransferase involved in cellulose biosynthesis